MVNEEDFSEKSGDAGSTRPYWDPALVNSRRKFRQFVQFLRQRQLLRFTTEPLDHVGVFFVWKKGRTKIRLVTDARGQIGKLDLRPMSLYVRPRLSHASKLNSWKAPFHNLRKDGGY